MFCSAGLRMTSTRAENGKDCYLEDKPTYMLRVFFHSDYSSFRSPARLNGGSLSASMLADSRPVHIFCSSAISQSPNLELRGSRNQNCTSHELAVLSCRSHHCYRRGTLPTGAWLISIFTLMMFVYF